MLEDLKLCEKYRYADATYKPNFMLIPVNRIPLNEEGIEEFNSIYRACLGLKKFVRTPSKGLSIVRDNLRGMRYDLRSTTSLVELTVKDYDGRYYRFQVGYTPKGTDEVKAISGHKAWVEFLKVLKKFKVDITKYKVSREEGLRIKSQIPKPLIKIENHRIQDRTYEGVHHLDLNTSFMSGIAAKYPDLMKPINYIYQNRKSQDKAKSVRFKAILTHTYGYMQSEGVQYGYSALSKAGVEYNNDYIAIIANELIKSGRQILAYNTDGIWYKGDLYHDDYEGSQLGGWKNDHINCKIRFKSAGCYEFIEDGQYHPVMRGQSTYERVKPRSEWEWGDIYKGDAVSYKFIEDVGFIKEN